MVKRQFMGIVVAVFLAASVTACGSKEREELQQKVASLEQQLTKANSELAEKDAAATELRNIAEVAEKKLKEAQTTIDGQATKLAKIQVERDKLKADIAKLKKKKKR